MQRVTIWMAAVLAATVAACDTREGAEEKAGEGVLEDDEQLLGEGEEMAGEREPVAGRTGETEGTTELLKDAAQTMKQMREDAELKKMLDQAQGVFLVPRYGRVGVGIGGRGGQGVLVTQEQGQWSNPGFYDIGGISLGAQLGAEGGEIAMLLMSQPAVDSFKEENAFSLNAGAKLTLIDYSKLAQASAGKDVGDVVFWSDTEGAFAGATLSVTDISWDEEENQAYYGTKDVKPGAVIEGNVRAPQGAPTFQEQM